MKKQLFLFIAIALAHSTMAQIMTPEKLWQLGRVSAKGLSEDGTTLIYTVTTPQVDENSFTSNTYAIDIETGTASANPNVEALIRDSKTSPDGAWKIVEREEMVKKIRGEANYPEMDRSNVLIYDQLDIRHWDTFRDGSYRHIFLERTDGSKSIDLLEGKPYNVPTAPFGGSEDYTWSPDGKSIIYVCKKLEGKAYVNSTNTDLYRYTLETALTENLTAANPGYDTQPAFSANGRLAYLSMKRDGYESDKNDIKLFFGNEAYNLTADWDGTVNAFAWSDDGKAIFFTAPTSGTVQLYRLEVPAKAGAGKKPVQITQGEWDITRIIGQVGNTLYVGRTDMNHAKEIYSVDLKTGIMAQVTHVNDTAYRSITMSRVERRSIETTDGKSMLCWVIYPPDFDPSKKYPTLLYTQGGPQSALSQFYSFRWNFQVMAAKGYIVVAPNRRGMPGHGVAWNEQISKDWGGQNMDDYLSAIDALAKEPYVDNARLGCVGASYGGYSAFFLAGHHQGRFKSFIAHDGLFDLRSLYGTTEELFFVNWDIGEYLGKGKQGRPAQLRSVQSY